MSTEKIRKLHLLGILVIPTNNHILVAHNVLLYHNGHLPHGIFYGIYYGACDGKQKPSVGYSDAAEIRAHSFDLL